MKLLGKTFLASSLLMFLFVSVLLAGMADEPKGKSIFESSKCNTCHSVDAQKIVKTGKAKAPDLSEAGVSKQDFLEKFLLKEESLNGKKHPSAFKGSKEDLKELSKWLSGLKPATKKAD